MKFRARRSEEVCLSKDVVLITGGSSDVGCALIKNYDAQDRIFLAHYNQSSHKLETLRKEMKAEVIPLQADFRKEEEVKRFIEAVKAKGIMPNKIVHLAGSPVSPVRFGDLNWSKADEEMNIQVKSIGKIFQAFLPAMKKERKGKVVFMLSSVVVLPHPSEGWAYYSEYMIVKHALQGLMKSVISEYGKSGININAVSPSMIDTNFLKNLPRRMVEIIGEQHPMGRNATVADVVPAIRYLLSPESDYLLGVNLAITGGLVI